MVSATTSAQQANSAALLFSGTSPAGSIDSFAQQLTATLEQYLGESGNPSPFQINVRPASSQNSGQNSGDGQFLVTVTAPQQTSGTAAVAAAAPDDSQSTSLGSTPQSNPPDGYVSVPFGIGTTIAPTLQTVLDRQNAEMAVMSPAAILNQDAVSMAGDPMSGVSIPGTNMNWDGLTQDQQLAYEYAMNYGLPTGQTMQDYLNANLGPQTMANAPCSDPTMFSNT